MEMLKNKDVEELNIAASKIIKKAINEILNKKDYAVLGIVGGRSVPGVFYKLKNAEIPWEKVHIFMVDERMVPIDHEDSNFRLAEEKFILSLLAKGNMPRANVHPFVVNEYKEDKGIQIYEDELKSFGGKFDIILLSSGEDGHVCALYPDHHSIENEDEGFIMMDDSPKPPKERMTASRKLMQKSEVSLLLFLGEAKRNALNRFLDDKIGLSQCPAKLVDEIDQNYVLTDIV